MNPKDDKKTNTRKKITIDKPTKKNVVIAIPYTTKNSQANNKTKTNVDNINSSRLISAENKPSKLQCSSTNNLKEKLHLGCKQSCRKPQAPNTAISSSIKTTKKQDTGSVKKTRAKTEITSSEQAAQLQSHITQDKVYMTRSITCLLNDGSKKFQSSANPKLAIKGYLQRHKYVLRNLVHIISEAQSPEMCIKVVDIIFEMLIPYQILSKCSTTALLDCLNYFDNFKSLLGSIYIIDRKFSADEEYQDALPEFHIKLLQIITGLGAIDSNFAQLIRCADETIITFLGELLIGQPNKDLARSLHSVFKLLFEKKINCLILSNDLFFDALCASYQLTAEPHTITSLLKLISKSCGAFETMIKNDKIINLLIELLCICHLQLTDKNALLAMLYTAAQNDFGASLISNHENFNNLYNYFVNATVTDGFFYALKSYSILNRCLERIILPSVKQNKNLYLPPVAIEHLKDEEVSDESRSDNESDAENDSQHLENDSQHLENDTDDSICDDTIPLPTTPEHLPINTNMETKMKQFFFELFHEGDVNFDLSKFTIYKESGTSIKSSIAQNVHRISTKNKLAYPDFTMLEAISDKQVVNQLCNQIPSGRLCFKLGCATGKVQNPYTSHVVYDLDEQKSTQGISNPSVSVSSAPNKDANNSLQFDSHFECGNLQRALQIGLSEYDLLTSPDTLTNNGYRWFYFQISNMICGMNYTFNIINSTQLNNLYNYGMQPLMFSTKEHTLNGTGWKRAGSNIIYYGNQYTDEEHVRQYKTLSFCFIFPYNDDQVYLATHYPYTYTRLMTILAPLLNHESNNVYVRLDKLCNTVTNLNEVPLLTITAMTKSSPLFDIPFEKRPIIFLSARVHAGETNSSWIMEGIIKSLLNDTDEYAEAARNNFIFKIIPMLNPEGVICGNCRRGLTGRDLNRCWTYPNEFTCPEIFYSKKLVEYAKREINHPIAAFIDIHGHSKKKCFFFYGCNPRTSWNKQDFRKGDRLEVLQLLPKVIRTLNNNIRLSFCEFRIAKYKESTARIVMWREFGIEHSLTLECSYSEGNAKQSVDTGMLADIGASVIGAFGKIAIQLFELHAKSSSFALDFRDQPAKKSDRKKH